jgi:membrane associated rhomboid family serine protease
LPAAGGNAGMQGGVAYWAHVGGFAGGLLLATWFARRNAKQIT